LWTNLPYFRQRLITGQLSALLLFQPLFTESSCGNQPCPSPILWCTFSNSILLLCVSSQFLVYCLVFFFFREVQSAQGAMLVFPRGGSTVGLPNVCQAGLEPASAGVAALLFSQCNVAWRNFSQARGSRCQSFRSPCCFISSKCSSSISARF
jgi:hypothetical protein